jgi:hypothetical protein
LHFASQQGEVELGCLLLDHGADLNATDSKHITLLNVAKDGPTAKALMAHCKKFHFNEQSQIAISREQEPYEVELKQEKASREETEQFEQNSTARTSLAHEANGCCAKRALIDDTAVSKVVKLLETLISQQKEGTKGPVAAVENAVNKRILNQEEQQKTFIAEIAEIHFDNKTGREEELKEENALLRQRLERLEKLQGDHQQLEKDKLAAARDRNISIDYHATSIKTLLETLVSQQSDNHKVLISTIDNKNVDRTTASPLERVAESNLHDAKLKSENAALPNKSTAVVKEQIASLEQRLVHLEEQLEKQRQPTHDTKQPLRSENEEKKRRLHRTHATNKALLPDEISGSVLNTMSLAVLLALRLAVAIITSILTLVISKPVAVGEGEQCNESDDEDPEQKKITTMVACIDEQIVGWLHQQHQQQLEEDQHQQEEEEYIEEPLTKNETRDLKGMPVISKRTAGFDATTTDISISTREQERGKTSSSSVAAFSHRE